MRSPGPSGGAAGSGSGDRAASALLITAALTAVISRLSFLGQPFQNDAGLYIGMGRILADGQVLYRDYFETKLPSVAAVTAPLWMAFGNRWWCYVVLQLVAALSASIVFWRSLRRDVGAAAAFPALLYLLVMLNFSRIVLTGFQLESLQAAAALLSAAAALAALRANRASEQCVHGLLTGLFAGVAAMLKPTGLAVLGAYGIALLWRTPWRPAVRQIGASAAGFGVVLAANTAWAVTSSFASELPEVWRQIQLYASETPWQALLVPKTPVLLAVPLYPLVVRWALMRSDGRNRVDTHLRAFAVLWFLLELTGVVLQRRAYAYHFLTLVPPLALLYGLMPFERRLLPVAAGIVPAMLASLAFAVPNLTAIPSGLRPLAASRYLVGHTLPTDSIWADPSPRLLLETGRRPGARLPYTIPLANHDDAPLEFGQTLLADFEARQPKYILLQPEFDPELTDLSGWKIVLRLRPVRLARYRDAMRQLREYVATHYHPETEVDGFVVYRRNESSPTALP